MINRERMVKEFQELVAIDAPSYGERNMADRLKEKLTALGFEVSEDDAGKKLNGNAGNVYGFLKGDAKGAPLLFSSHMDTVEPSRGKRAIVHDDGTITSAGDTVLGSDDVAGLVEILEAIRHLKEEGTPHRDIEVLFPVAEEVFLQGTRVYDFSQIKSKEAYVLDISGAPGEASLKEPTHISFDVTVTGRAAHAGFNPEDGINAIAVCAAAIAAIKQGRVDEDSTVNIGAIEGGRAENIVPEVCHVRGEIRSFRDARARELLTKIKATFTEYANGATLSFSEKTNLLAYETPKSHPVVRRFQNACLATGLKGTVTATLGGSDNNWFARNGITGIVLSCGMNDVHSTKEYTTIEQLAQGAALVARLITSD